MYKCQVAGCKKSSQPGQRAIRQVVQTRKVTYPPRHIWVDGFQKKIDNGGEGEEIVREINVCYSCAGAEKPESVEAAS